MERHGGVIIRGGEEAEKHLASLKVDAAYIAGAKAIVLHEDATVSEVLEEVHHFQQDERGDYADLPDDEMRIRREIDAQNYLLSVAKRYNIPESETAQTRNALEKYEAKLAEIEGGGGK